MHKQPFPFLERRVFDKALQFVNRGIQERKSSFHPIDKTSLIRLLLKTIDLSLVFLHLKMMTSTYTIANQTKKTIFKQEDMADPEFILCST
ncbi:hypothetical protein Y958_20680 [Nitrospirillum viridazoti CBAmc]|uniref:Uncharacterized protein n=1 Tax=Nitrospirillum viridazoti CBAmc TaxID=1441467 RepID=A0A248JXE1_9PROT|nr:hypothetical protein Y958_20680 [Nitrospirillum amazonense CBAmc]